MKDAYAYISVYINQPFVEVPCSFFGILGNLLDLQAWHRWRKCTKRRLGGGKIW
jgi:hypothetical protein